MENLKKLRSNKIGLLFFSFFVFLVFGISNTFAATTTISYAGAATDLLDSTMSWSNPGNATGNTTGTRADVFLVDRRVDSNTLSLTNFNLSAAGLPAGSIVNGIQVDVEWEGTNTRVRDSMVQLTKDGTTLVGSNYGTNTNGTASKVTDTYGGATDLWGTSWTYSELTSVNFGVHLRYLNRLNANHTAYVYRVGITIDYTPNNTPTNITLSNQDIPSAVPIGSLVGTMTTTDVDVGDSHTYSLACSVPGVDDASFEISGSNLNSNAIFDHTVKSTYNICIRTDDGRTGVYDKNFIITILPPAPNNAPTDITLSNQDIFELLPIGSNVGSLSTIDADTWNTHTYSFSCSISGADDGSFSFSGSDLNSAETFDEPTKSTYNICIRTDDGNGGTFDKNFVITILVNPHVGYAGATNSLGGGTFPWVNISNGIGNTTTTSTTLTISTKNAYSDFLSFTDFNLFGTGLPSDAIIEGIQVDVELQASGNGMKDRVLQLTKDGVNPVGSDYGNYVNRSTTKSITTYGGATDLWGTTWTATELLSSNFGVYLQYRNTNNNSRDLDIFRVNVIVTYNALPTDITLSSNSIDEGLPIGTTVGTLTTVDPDVGDTHTYSFACDTPGADDGSFTIAGSNLNSGAVFNYATKSTYNICIRTDDGGGGVYDKNFTINVLPFASPGGISSGLQVWLKADLGTSTTTDGVGVTTWSDQSGNGYDATTGVAPIYRDNATTHLNFNPLVDFNGTTQYLQNLANGAYSQSYYAVVVPDTDVNASTPGEVPFGLECTNAVNSSGNCGLPFAGLTLGAFTAAINDEVVTHAIGSSTAWRSAEIGAASYDLGLPLLIGSNENTGANGTDIYIDGTQKNNYSANSYETLSATDYSVGRSMDAANPFYYDGKIAEVINYDSRLTDTERQQIESYLALKYGITLNNGTQNYLASDETTTMWDTTTGTGYLNDIFGVGRDDLTGLGQVKSKSESIDNIITMNLVGEGTNASPSFFDVSNKEFLSISNDYGGATWTATDAPTGYSNLNRKWRVQETGELGTVNLEFDVGNTDFDVPVLSLGTSYYFTYDSDNDDLLADETPQVMINSTGNIWQISGVDLNDGREFTITTQASTNNIPTDISLSNSSLAENVAIGTTVGTLSTSDLDVSDTHTYSFVSGSGDDDNSLFTIAGSIITINESPDYEVNNSYSVRIQTDDGNGGQFQKSFPITITNVGETIATIIDFENPGKYTETVASWTRTTNNPNEGSYSIESDNGGLNNTQSCFETDVTLTSTGTIDFDYTVSSEINDYLRFYVDTVEEQAWSGNVAWTTYTQTDIPAGTHNYKWCYIKNGATNGGTDNAFIDYITFTDSAVDIVAPVVSFMNYSSGTLLPGGDQTLVFNYTDDDSGIDTSSDSLVLQKWNGTAWGSDISGTGIGIGTITVTSASYPTLDLDYGKYRVVFNISDNSANTSVNFESVFYIDEPEFSVSTPEIDVGNVNSSTNTFSADVTVIVKTVGAGFTLKINENTDLTYDTEVISSWDTVSGYGYDKEVYTGNINTINTDEIIATQTGSINTDGDYNTYTYDLRIGVKVDPNQVAGDYEGGIDFDVDYDY